MTTTAAPARVPARVLLSSPSLLPALEPAATPTTPATSWIQVAKTGTFVSNRYGTFAITPEDLVQMAFNFQHITPASPTQLPIDYDHLSMEPKKPGDGVAAGWMEELQLRHGGSELWARVSWTPQAADAIRAGAYKFVSPSFVKDYTHKDGRHIGCTLLAAAVTNHPFLEGMSALTLYNFSTMGDLAMQQTPDRPVHLAEQQQWVTFVDDAEQVPGLTPEQRAGVYKVTSTFGEGDDQGVGLATPDGQPFGWGYARISQLRPARAPETVPSPLPSEDTDPVAEAIGEQTIAEARRRAAEEVGLHATNPAAARLNTLAQAEAAAQHVSLRAAVTAISARPEHRDLVTRYHDHPVPEAVAAPVPRHLSRHGEETFATLVGRVAREQQVSLRTAMQQVAAAHPGLAAAYAAGETA